MHSQLNITNGDCAVTIMKQAKISGDFLPWRDVLHDGPVPSGLTLEALSKCRAQFIAQCGWGVEQEVHADFIKRDNTLKSYKNYSKVTLWFEHDLYDQLQLIQILDWFNQQAENTLTLSIICTDQYLGHLCPEEMLALVSHEQTITQKHLSLASKAWRAFRDAEPQNWLKLLGDDLSPLPFLKSAIIRLLEEYPSHSNGLSRTAMQALSIIAAGEQNPINIFTANQQKEDRIYLGDSSFWIILNNLLKATPPLLELKGADKISMPISKKITLSVTQFGHEVLLGKANYLDSILIDRWLGGVHLNQHTVWLWDNKALIKR